MESLGIIAGNGRFPFILAQAARERGDRVIAVGHKGHTEAELEKFVDQFHLVEVGQLGKIIETFKQAGVTQVVMAGSLAKSAMYSQANPDSKGFEAMAKLRNRKDDVILRAVAEELEKEGMRVREATAYLSFLLAPNGCLTSRQPDERELEDIRFGWEIAKEIGRLDIGQSVVVKDKAVLAVEAIDGTDATIRRGTALSGPGAVVVKVSKPNQDIRFDLPVVGLTTVSVLAEGRASALALEAQRTIIFDKGKVIQAANHAGLAILSL
jgi:DUF1009 family protein